MLGVPVGVALIRIALFVALGCVIVLILVWKHGRPRTPAFSELRDARIVASDTGLAPSQLLRDRSNGLYGKPDYLLSEGTGKNRSLIPLELKPNRRSNRLYESDMIQLGVYVLATRATYGRQAANFGIVRYATATFRVEMTAALERRIHEIAAAIRAGRSASVVHRSHDVSARCAGCAMRPNCNESLV